MHWEFDAVGEGGDLIPLDQCTHEKYPLLSAQVITTLDSGGKKSVNWDQIDSTGKNLRPGNYTATTSTGLINANVTFAIS